MTEIIDMTNNVLNLVLNKEDDYYSYFYKKILNNNDVLYSSNILANNLLHVDFNNYVYDEIVYILDCATKLISYTMEFLNNKETYTKEEIKVLEFATIQILDIYSDILTEFISDEEYQFLSNLRKYKNTNEQIVNEYLEKYYNKSELIKLIYIYFLLKNDQYQKAKDIYLTYQDIDNKHPFYHLGNNIHNEIKNIFNENN